MKSAKAGHSAHGLHWLMGFGTMGLFVVSVIDSSIIPLPLPGSTDLLLILLVVHRADPVLAALAAFAGSILGGYLTWKRRRQRRRSSAPSLSSQAICATPDRLGGEERHAGRRHLGIASAAIPADAVRAGLRRPGGFAKEVLSFLRLGSSASLFAGDLAGRHLWQGDGARISPLSLRVEHHPHVGVFGVDGGRHFVRGLEVSHAREEVPPSRRPPRSARTRNEPGPNLEPADVSIREHFHRLQKNSCFVSGHDFSRAAKDWDMTGFSAPASGSSRTK